MNIATAHLKSTAPYSQSKQHWTPKILEGKETHDAHEKRTWREKMHVTEDGYLFIPPIQFKWCIEEAASHLSMKVPETAGSKFTKHFKRGILVTDGIILPIKKEDVVPEWRSMNPQGIRGGRKRVPKALPTIYSWEGDVTFYVADDVITEPVFRKHLECAGMFIGIGTHRPGNGGYKGRFEVVSVDWQLA